MSYPAPPKLVKKKTVPIVHLGAFAVIDMDLVGLRRYVEENTKPAPGAILNLRKWNILESWEILETTGKCGTLCGAIVIGVSREIADGVCTSSEEI